MAHRQLIFHQIFTHIQRAKRNSSNYSFFGEQTEGISSASIAHLPENELVNWIFGDRFLRQHLVGDIMGRQEIIQHRLQLKEDILEWGQKPGDVDILLWPENRPQLAVAIECKRVKVQVDESGLEKANKLQGITKGIWQSNQLRSLGFHRTYLLILIVTDGRNKKQVNSLFRHANSETIQEVYNIPWHEELDNEVGVIYVQITQPTGLSHNEMYGFGVCIDKQCSRLEQSRTLTDKIRRLEKQ